MNAANTTGGLAEARGFFKNFRLPRRLCCGNLRLPNGGGASEGIAEECMKFCSVDNLFSFISFHYDIEVAFLRYCDSVSE